jgi:hypothetical protein
MNTLKTYLIACLLFMGILNLKAQNYEVSVRTGDQISINNLLGEIKIEQHTGSKLVIETNFQKEIPERARGLKPIYSNGLKDNTGIGINVSKEGKVVNVTGLGKQTDSSNYLLKIPKGVDVRILSQSPYARTKTIEVNNVAAEIEIIATNPDVKMDNVTGPVILNLINGNVDINFSKVNQQTPVAISAINGNVDITMPSNTPANLAMGSIHGELFTDFDINFGEKEKKGLAYAGGGEKIKGTINGGGVKFSVNAINENIYLRKK